MAGHSPEFKGREFVLNKNDALFGGVHYAYSFEALPLENLWPKSSRFNLVNRLRQLPTKLGQWVESKCGWAGQVLDEDSKMDPAQGYQYQNPKDSLPY